MSLSRSAKIYPVHKLVVLALQWAIMDEFHNYLLNDEFSMFTGSTSFIYALQLSLILHVVCMLLLFTATPSDLPITYTDMFNIVYMTQVVIYVFSFRTKYQTPLKGVM